LGVEKIMFTKEQQLKKNRIKETSKGSFGKPKSKSKEVKDYFHSSDKKCVVCGASNIELHHLTDISRINGKRRCDFRIVILCVEHHRTGKDAIHRLSKYDFYTNVLSFEKLIKHSKEIHNEFKENKTQQ
jgi:hypothetical protein